MHRFNEYRLSGIDSMPILFPLKGVPYIMTTPLCDSFFLCILTCPSIALLFVVSNFLESFRRERGQEFFFQ